MVKIKRIYDTENGVYINDVYAGFIYSVNVLEKMKRRQKPIQVYKKGLFGERWINKAIVIEI